MYAKAHFLRGSVGTSETLSKSDFSSAGLLNQNIDLYKKGVRIQPNRLGVQNREDIPCTQNGFGRDFIIEWKHDRNRGPRLEWIGL